MSVIEELHKSGRDLWMNTVRKYIYEADLGLKSVKETSLKEIKENMTKWNTEKRKREVNEKSSLELYKLLKTEIKGERIYNNDSLIISDSL